MLSECKKMSASVPHCFNTVVEPFGYYTPVPRAVDNKLYLLQDVYVSAWGLDNTKIVVFQRRYQALKFDLNAH